MIDGRMNKMVKNKNRLEIRLDPDSLELLNSLLARTSLTKTSLIKKALIVYASSLKNGHIYTVKLKGETIKEKEKTFQFDDEPKEKNEDIEKISVEDWEKLFPQKDNDDEIENDKDELPF